MANAQKVILLCSTLFSNLFAMGMGKQLGGSTSDVQDALKAIDNRKVAGTSKDSDKSRVKALKDLMKLHKQVKDQRGKVSDVRKKHNAINGSEKPKAKAKAKEKLDAEIGNLKDLMVKRDALKKQLGWSTTAKKSTKTTKKSKTPSKPKKTVTPKKPKKTVTPKKPKK